MQAKKIKKEIVCRGEIFHLKCQILFAPVKIMQQQKSNISKNIEKKNKTHAPEKIMQQKKGTVVKKIAKK